MEENVYLVKWYGPFTCQEEVKEWEEKQKFKCSLYLLHGKKKNAKTKEMYYCGETTRSVYKRFCDKGHHIEEIKDRLHSIYVGCISNVKRPTRKQTMAVEKIITAYLAYNLGDENVMNATNKYFPPRNVFVINEWWKSNLEGMWERQPKNAPSNIVPDVIVFHYNDNVDNELLVCKKMKRL